MSALAKVTVLVICLFAVAPLVWHGLSSVKRPAELARIPPTVLPAETTIENYSDLFTRRPFGAYYMNSLVISTLASLLCVVVGSMAAFGLARSPGRVRSVVTAALLGVAFFPPIVFLFPLYEMVRAAGLVNHPWSLILPYAALNLPFAIWMLTGYFRQLPGELEEAAAMDGMNRFQIYRKIVMPLSAPALVTTGLLVFIFSWNEFMFALTFMNQDSAKTVTVGVAGLSGAFLYEIPWGLLTSGVIASSVPLILLVVLFQKRIVAGLVAGVTK